jgi:hypothetical protein
VIFQCRTAAAEEWIDLPNREINVELRKYLGRYPAATIRVSHPDGNWFEVRQKVRKLQCRRADWPDWRDADQHAPHVSVKEFLEANAGISEMSAVFGDHLYHYRMI